ncbi:hypothetical protein [Streptantibioticus silvisoli]|uniref:Cholesterol esterase n=1 Tax=Streptantibioticus silvisoli TaxID=2705255 RepID=A0ABT6VRU5_9ACTN|nr:hypothetical protein [Streptantibioticus silvisoli]MDI5961198.1 hypothetical protein [Streptantibioticus silvisoli]
MSTRRLRRSRWGVLVVAGAVSCAVAVAQAPPADAQPAGAGARAESGPPAGPTGPGVPILEPVVPPEQAGALIGGAVRELDSRLPLRVPQPDPADSCAVVGAFGGRVQHVSALPLLPELLFLRPGYEFGLSVNLTIDCEGFKAGTPLSELAGDVRLICPQLTARYTVVVSDGTGRVVKGDTQPPTPQVCRLTPHGSADFDIAATRAHQAGADLAILTATMTALIPAALNQILQDEPGVFAPQARG